MREVPLAGSTKTPHPHTASGAPRPDPWPALVFTMLVRGAKGYKRERERERSLTQGRFVGAGLPLGRPVCESFGEGGLSRGRWLERGQPATPLTWLDILAACFLQMLLQERSRRGSSRLASSSGIAMGGDDDLQTRHMISLHAGNTCHPHAHSLTHALLEPSCGGRSIVAASCLKRQPARQTL